MNKTLEYYDKHTKEFIESTQSVDFTKTQNRFLSYLPNNATILDFGCGSGRDTPSTSHNFYTSIKIEASF